jgi:hypothetical protein
MSPSPESVNSALPVPQAGVDPRQNTPKSDDLPYMMMTVIAIILLLGSLWIF